MSEQPLLELRNVCVDVPRAGRRTPIRIVDGVSMTVARGESIGIIGESGCGKTLTALSIVRLLPAGGSVSGGTIAFDGTDLATRSEEQMRAIRGGRIAMIFQDPMVALDPLFTIGDQMDETMREHLDLPPAELRSRSIALLEAVGISDPEGRLRQHPHEMSGGMLQRIVGAIAISCNAELVIADEPTTALDPTLQAQFLELLAGLKRDRGMSVILVTHDFGAAARLCKRIVVMYAGQIVERGTTREVFESPGHPYARALIDALAYGEPGTRGRLNAIEGQPPDLADVPPGCRFAPRCAFADDRCRTEFPPDVELAPGHVARCWKAGTTA
jgi:oligopeptide/dipeptide ABC transporter ATP-binding protein